VLWGVGRRAFQIRRLDGGRFGRVGCALGHRTTPVPSRVRRPGVRVLSAARRRGR
jgi:hypothetical protein